LHVATLKKTMVALIAVAVTTGVAAMLFLKDGDTAFSINQFNFKEMLSHLNFQQRYLLQLPFLLAVLLLGYWAIVKKKSVQMICFITIADLSLATQFNMPVTVFGARRFANIEKLMDRNPVPFPLPDRQSIQENSRNSIDENMLTGSRLPFTKKIGRNDYYITPGNLSKQDEFYESPLRDRVFKNPLLYFADNKWTANKQIATTANDGNIQINQFNANSLEAVADKKTPGLLVYLQNNYPGWKALIDGKQTPVMPVNITYLSIQVPAGKHSIIFTYQPQAIINAWYVSIGSFIVLVIIYCRLFFSKRRSTIPQNEKESI